MALDEAFEIALNRTLENGLKNDLDMFTNKNLSDEELAKWEKLYKLLGALFYLNFKENLFKTLSENKGKVEKTTALKDMADALTGAIYNAQMNYYDVPLYDYEAINNPTNTEDYNNLISSNETITTLF